MKIKKSRLCIMLTVTMLLTLMSSSMVFADTLNYGASVTKMQQLGILEKAVKGGSLVTRGQLVKSLAIADGLVSLSASSNGTTMFPDITPNSTLSGYVNSVVNAGLMFGMPNGYFQPNAGVTYAEECTIMVRLLGYTDTTVPGVWPTNYIKKASDLKLTTGLTLKKGDKLTNNQEAVLFNRLLATLTTAGSNFSTTMDSIVYGSPQIALNFDVTSNTLGSITFDDSTPIVENGQNITKADILDNDVLYLTTDINGGNRKILVFNSRVEGNITAFESTSTIPTSIMVDKVAYTYSKDMDTSMIKTLNVGDLVTVIQGYDGKVIAVNAIDHKTGDLIEATILENSKTSADLIDNKVVTDKGTYTLNTDAGTVEIGAKYKLYVDSTNATAGATATTGVPAIITKVGTVQNSVENYAIKNVAGSIITYTGANNVTKPLVLPKASSYYHHGAYVDYDTAVKNIQSYSSVILTKKSNGSGYDNAIIVDPSYSSPQIYKNDNVKLLDQIKNTKYDSIYRNANITEADFNAYDVVYFVSDLWSKNTFIYVTDKTVIGTITAFTPDMINPISVTVNAKILTFSKYFDKNQLNNYDGNIGNFITNTSVGDFRTFLLGVDGTIVGMHQ